MSHYEQKHNLFTHSITGTKKRSGNKGKPCGIHSPRETTDPAAAVITMFRGEVINSGPEKWDLFQL